MAAEKREMMLIGYHASPFVSRIRIVLKLKSIEYELVKEDPTRKSEFLITSNPIYKKVPVLIHGNQPPIQESRIIMEYIDELCPDIHPIFPSLTSNRAHIRFCAFYFDDQVMKMYDKLMVAPEQEREKIKLQITESSQLLEQEFVKCSDGKPYFGGDDIGFLDIVIGSFYGWTQLFEKIYEFKVYDEVRTPRLSEWAKRISSHEAVKAVVPDDEALMNLYKVYSHLDWTAEAGFSMHWVQNVKMKEEDT